jgi:bifunctional non-homologous end joining protein LigD
MVFDLDPGAPANVVQCCEAALWLRGIFGQLGLQSFAKTSGSKGLQVYVPLNTPVSYDETKAFAHELARLLQTVRPDLIVADMKKSLRTGKVFVDWSQNDDHKTTVCVYSLRAKERPTVSTPVAWDEVEECREKQDSGLLVFLSDQVLERIESSDDLFGAVLELKQKLPPLDTLGHISLSEKKAVAPTPAKPPKRKPASAARAGRKRVKAAGPNKHAA